MKYFINDDFYTKIKYSNRSERPIMYCDTKYLVFQTCFVVVYLFLHLADYTYIRYSHLYMKLDKCEGVLILCK